MGNKKSRDNMSNKENIIDNKRKWQIYAFAGLTFSLILAIHLMLVLNRWLDNDIYFYLGLGRYMWENKIVPEYHPFYIGGYLYNMIPQWLYDVAAYLINEACGYAGLFSLMIFWELLGAFFLYKIARLKNVDKIASIALILMMFYISTGVVTIRTNLMTLSLTIMQIYLLERYKEGNKIRFLIPLPFLSIFEMNAHMALWFMHLCIMAAYICPQFRMPFEVNRHNYKLKPLIYTSLIMFEAGMINPYGLRAYFFVKDGISEDSLAMIEEMQPLAILTGEGLGIIVCVMVLLYAILKKKTSYEYLYIFAGLTFLGVNQSRNMHWGFLGIIILAFDVLKDTNFMTNYSRFVPKKVTGFLPFTIFLIFILLFRPQMFGKGLNCNLEYEQTLEKMISIIEQDPDHSKNIFNDNGMGNYLEYKGYNIYLDTRMDGSMPGFTGGYDILGEYKNLNFMAGKAAFKAILDKYDYDYAIVMTNGRLSLYMQLSDDYELLYKNQVKNAQENLQWDISLFKKVR